MKHCAVSHMLVVYKLKAEDGLQLLQTVADGSRYESASIYLRSCPNLLRTIVNSASCA